MTGHMRGKPARECQPCSYTKRMLCRCPSVLGLSPERAVQPKLDCLVRLGVAPDDLRRVVLLAPQILTLSLASISAKVAAPPNSQGALTSWGFPPEV